MAPRRVAAALASDDPLEDSIRRDVLGAQDDQPDDRTRNDNPDDQDDEADDQQQDDGADDQGDDQQQDDTQVDPENDQRPAPDAERERRRRLAARRAEPAGLDAATEARIATAERIAADAVARADALVQQFGQPRESPEQEAARLATMTPEQIIDYKLGKALGQHNQNLRNVEFNAWNSTDKTSFEGLLRDHPQLKRFAVEVERKRDEMIARHRRTGEGVPPRDMVLKYMLGERALDLAQKAAPQQRAREQRVQRQEARPGDNRSGVSPNRRREQTAEQRLAGVQI